MATRTPKTNVNRVLVLLDVTDKGGQLVLRALHGWQTVLAEKTFPLTATDLSLKKSKVNADHAKLIALIKALKRLTSKLPSDQTAPYHVVVVQRSKTVHSWLTDPSSRKNALAHDLGAYVDTLAARFPQLQFEQRERKVMTQLLTAH